MVCRWSSGPHPQASQPQQADHCLQALTCAPRRPLICTSGLGYESCLPLPAISVSLFCGSSFLNAIAVTSRPLIIFLLLLKSLVYETGCIASAELACCCCGSFNTAVGLAVALQFLLKFAHLIIKLSAVASIAPAYCHAVLPVECCSAASLLTAVFVCGITQLRQNREC